MRKTSLLSAALGLFVLLALPSARAASLGPKGKIFAEFDTNKNGVIDGDEIAAVRKAYAADPKGPLAVYDTNKDGKLDDAEIAAIKPPGGKKDGAAKKEGGKKKAAAPAATPAPAEETPAAK